VISKLESARFKRKVKIIDHLDNFIRYPMTLKTNFYKFDLPNLEELYLSFSLQIAQNEIKTKRDLKNFSNDISIFFSVNIEQLTNLKILWLKGIGHKLLVNEYPITSLHYQKLHLDNVNFQSNKAEEFLKNLVCCEELHLIS
jgi:hypothetical protein